MEASPLNGSWKQVASLGPGHDCDAITTRPCGWSSAARENEVQFSGLKFTRQVTGYADLKKQLPQWTKKVIGKFAISKPPGSDVSHLDIKFQSVYLIALSGKKSAVWNRIKFCGRRDWKVNIEQNVTGRVCDPLPMRVPGSTYYTSVALQDSKLYFAEDSNEKDGSSPTSRPTQPEMTNAWIQK